MDGRNEGLFETRAPRTESALDQQFAQERDEQELTSYEGTTYRVEFVRSDDDMPSCERESMGHYGFADVFGVDA